MQLSLKRHPLQIWYPDLHLSREVAAAVRWSARNGFPVPHDAQSRLACYLDRLVLVLLRETHEDKPLRALRLFRHKLMARAILKPEDVPESVLTHFPTMSRTDAVTHIISAQRTSLEAWITYFSSSQGAVLSPWIVYHVFRSILSLGRLDLGTGSFATRRHPRFEMHDGKRVLSNAPTTAPYPELCSESLEGLTVSLERLSHGALSPQERQRLTRSFGSLYAQALTDKLTSERERLDDTQGVWIVYRRRDPLAPRALAGSLLGKGTGWCTTSYAVARDCLKAGDHHVYYSNNRRGVPTYPRIAIRMFDQDVFQISGLGPKQNLEPTMIPILEEKLKSFPDSTRRFSLLIADAKRLADLLPRVRDAHLPDLAHTLSHDDLVFLFQRDRRIHHFGVGLHPDLTALHTKIDTVAVLNVILSPSRPYRPEEITTSLEMLAYRTLSDSPTSTPRVHVGDISCDIFYPLFQQSGSDPSRVLVTLFGDLDVRPIGPERATVELPRQVYGSLAFRPEKTGTIHYQLPVFVRDHVLLSGLVQTRGLVLPRTIGGNMHCVKLSKAALALHWPDHVGGTIYVPHVPPSDYITLCRRYPHLRFVNDMP